MSTHKNAEQTHEPAPARRALLTSGAVGLAAVAGATFGMAQPASADTVNVTWITPTNDPTGNKDTAAIQAALNSNGFAWLAPGTFYVNAQITIPHKGQLQGSGGNAVTGTAPASQTRINSLLPDNGGGTFYMHDPNNDGNDRQKNSSGSIRDIVIDGSGAGNGCYGIDIGDGWGYRLDHVFIENFTGTGSIGLFIHNQSYFTEKMTATNVHLRNNLTGCQIGPNIPADHSMEYNDLELYFSIGPTGSQAQSGVSLVGSNFTGSSLVMRGNVYQQSSAPPVSFAVLALNMDLPNNQISNLQDTFVDIRLEEDGSGSGHITKVYFSDTSQMVNNCYGLISITGLGLCGVGSGLTAPAAGQFQFRGWLIGNSGIPVLRNVTTPTFPLTGHSVTNTQNDCMVYISGGGSISNISINTNSIGVTSGPVYLPANAAITISYTGTLSWTWVSCL